MNEITLEQYMGEFMDHPDATPERLENARIWVGKANQFRSLLLADGLDFFYNFVTKSVLSGSKYGGFRPQNAPVGAPNSSHKKGKAGDLYDPFGELDIWIMRRPKIEGWPDVLVQLDMSIEHPSATKGWCHLQDGTPPSGNRVYYP